MQILQTSLKYDPRQFLVRNRNFIQSIHRASSLQSGRLALAQVELRLVAAARLDARSVRRLQRVRQPLLQGRGVAPRLRRRRRQRQLVLLPATTLREEKGVTN